MSEDPASKPDLGHAPPSAPVDDDPVETGRTPSPWFPAAVVTALAVIMLITATVSFVPDHDRLGLPIATQTRSPTAGVTPAIRKTSSPIVATSTAPLGVVPPTSSRDNDVCGMPGVVSDVAHPLAEDPAFAERIVTSHRRLAELLASQPDERSHTVAHLVHGAAQAERARAEFAQAEAERCGPDKDCIAAMDPNDAWTVNAMAVRSDADAIARAAATTRDPFVYAVAVDVCRSPRSMPAPASACQLVTAEQWARLDPANASAWLHVADGASGRGDSAALDDAMRHVAQAKVSRIYGNLVPGIVDAAVPADAATFEAEQMREVAWQLAASWSFPPLQLVTSYCARPLLLDSNRLQVCDAIAHRLVDDGSTLIERAVGIAVGERVGWPAEQVTALRRGNRSLQNALLAAAFLDVAPDSCRALAKKRTVVLEMARVGEVGAARSALAASGKNDESIEDEARDAMSEVSKRMPAASAPEPASAATSG